MPALPEEQQPGRVALGGAQAPAAEPELVVARLEVQRVLRGLPDVGRTVQTRSLVVSCECARVAGQGDRGLDATGEDEPLRQHLDHLARRRDAEPLQRGREVDPGHRTFDQLGQQLALPRLRHAGHLPGERPLPVVDELPGRELGLVAPSDRGQEHVLQGGAVVGDRELGERKRQAHAAQQVVGLRPGERHEQRLAQLLEFLGRRERQAGEELLEPGEHRRVVFAGQTRLRQAEAAVGVHHLRLEARGRDEPTVLVRPLDERLHQRDPLFATQDGRKAFLPALLATGGEPELTEERFLLPTSESPADIFERNFQTRHATTPSGFLNRPNGGFAPSRGPGPALRIQVRRRFIP